MAVSSQATTEQFQIAQRLLEILSPYGLQTRTDMIERGGRFVHYTSAENGLSSILRTYDLRHSFLLQLRSWEVFHRGSTRYRSQAAALIWPT